MRNRDRLYDPDVNYYFMDYRLWENGHPEYVNDLKKENKLPKDVNGNPIENYKGVPRWIRQDFMTQEEVMFVMNRILNSYPDRVENFRIQSDIELSEIVTVEKEGSKLLFKGDKGFEEGDKMTMREYRFGRMYSDVADKFKNNKFELTTYY